MRRFIAIVTLMIFPILSFGQSKYDPDVFALESGRGRLASEYFGVRLSDLKKTGNGMYTLSEDQRSTIKEHILGRHMCSLQWISWKDFGSVRFFEDEKGRIACKGGQESKDSDDYLRIDGIVTIVSPLEIRITGTISTKVSHINGGRPVERKGTYRFTIEGARGYWRMQEMANPAASCCDYVDIYF